MPISFPPAERRGPPRRIVSLLPASTDIVSALGLEEALVGVSHSCDFPGPIAGLPRVTRTRVPPDAPSAVIDAMVRDCLARGESLYRLEAELVDALAPDLVITQSLCDVCAVGPNEVARALPAIRSAPEVLELRPETLDGVLGSIELVGEATGRRDAAARLVAGLRKRIERVREGGVGNGQRPRVALLEWADPPICGGHWNPELVEIAGGIDGLGRAGRPSRTVAWDEIVAFEPEVLVLACCGFDRHRAAAELGALERRPGFDRLPCARTGRVYAVDGVRLFSRPGPSLVDSLEVLAAIVREARVRAPLL